MDPELRSSMVEQRSELEDIPHVDMHRTATVGVDLLGGDLSVLWLAFANGSNGEHELGDVRVIDRPHISLILVHQMGE